MRMLLTSLLLAIAAHADPVTVSWGASPSVGVTDYRIYRIDGVGMSRLASVSAVYDTATVDVQDGWIIAVTAYDADTGMESPPSTPITVHLAPPVPAVIVTVQTSTDGVTWVDYQTLGFAANSPVRMFRMRIESR